MMNIKREKPHHSDDQGYEEIDPNTVGVHDCKCGTNNCHPGEVGLPNPVLALKV
jgi:hypothetical protein